MEVLDSNGFTPERFQSVGYAVGMAMAGLEMRKDNVDVAAQRAETAKAIAEMKTQLPPAQVEAFTGHMQAADKMLAAIEQQPQANLDLVAPHTAEIEALSAEDDE
jgi:hypothetical protein